MRIKNCKNIPQALAAAWCLALLAVACAFAQQPTPTTAPPPSGYVLGPDDQIVIRALEGLDLGDKPVLIGTNGNITLPLIGRVQAAGLTVEQLEAELASRLKAYVQEPQVSVTVTEFRSQPVSVFGAVTTPGVIQLRGRKTLYEVLSMAGGPRETAGSTVSIIRLSEYGPIPLPGAGPDPTGRYSSAELDMQQILDGKNPAANIEIKPHDVISVSQGNARMVYVVGDVQRSGAFNLGSQRTISVLSAVSWPAGWDAPPSRSKPGFSAPLRTVRNTRRSPSTSNRSSPERRKTSACGPKTFWLSPPAAAKSSPLLSLPEPWAPR